MNKQWILKALIIAVVAVLAFGGGVGSEAVAYAAESSGPQNSTSIQDYDSHVAGKAPLHPDVVHGLVPSPLNAKVTGLLESPETTVFGEPLVGDRSPLHPDMVHGLVRPPFQPNVIADLRPTGN